MIRLTEIVGYPDLQYHIDNKLPLCENVYRYSSDSFLQLFREARELFDILLPKGSEILKLRLY